MESCMDGYKEADFIKALSEYKGLVKRSAGKKTKLT